MKTFDFPMHVLEVEYPESSVKVKYGRGYEFASRPRGPDQVIYILHFTGMWFFMDRDGFPPLGATAILDYNKLPQINMARLERFYQEHRLYEPFWYPHPVLGNQRVRFDEPLKYKIEENGHGKVEAFSVRLLTQP